MDGEESDLAISFARTLASPSPPSSSSSSSSPFTSLQKLLVFADALLIKDSIGHYQQDALFINSFKREVDTFLQCLNDVWERDILVVEKGGCDADTSGSRVRSASSKAQILYQAHRTVANLLGHLNERRFISQIDL